MKYRRKLLVLFVVLGFLSVASADKKKCYSGCRGSNTLYKYEDGTNYKYKLEGSTITTVPGSDGDVSKVSVAADVDISVQPQCSHILKVSNLQITGPDGKTQSSPELEAHPVKFSFHDGHIESEVCAEEDDSHSALNIKRAVISLLQSTVHKDAGATSHVETDVFGTCPTDFEFFKSGNVLKIKKIRNLSQCAHRESLNFPVFSTEYNINSDFQSSPFIISSSRVEQQVQDGIVQSVVGEEKYSYQPHATVESGVLVTVKTKLSFISQAKGAAITANVVKPKSIIFDAPHGTTESSTVESIQKALDQAERSVEPSVQPSAAQDFAELVEVLSHSKKADILAVFAGIKSKDTAKNILVDGIARASTGDAVEVLSELAQANELSKLQKIFWYTSLGFVKHVTRGSLKAVLPLLSSGGRQAYLGVGSLAARYCSSHHCENDAEFKELLNKIAEPISGGCKADSVEKEDKIITSLKSLHNVHHLTNEVVDKVSQCAADKNVKTRIRVAALETFQSDASKSKLKSTAISILKNLEEDSEVRIKAYLALVECPCNKVADVVKNVLENEEVNQVGSFITSHLRNLRATANPDRAAAKHFLSQIHVNKKFPVDIRKFSHNQELSYSIDALNLGAAGEQNVIFSEKSYIPRSYSLNLTSQIFGHAFNLVELNARTENLDYIFEKYFGPKGYFPAHDAKDIYETAFKSASSLKKKITDRYHESVRPKRETHFRHPRDISQLTSKFGEQVDLGIDSHDNDVDLDLSLKLYGAEVAWLSYHGNNKKVNPDNIIDKVFESVDESIEKAKNLDVDFKKLTTFLDAEAIYPTGLGLPLKLNTKGSSAVRVKLDGKVDVPAIIKDPKNAYIKFQIIPSASIELSGQLSVDAYVVESGVKVYGTIHSATGSDLSVRFIEGLGIDVKVGLPVKKQDIVSFNSNIVTITRGKGLPKSQAPVKFDTKRHEYNGCFDQLNPILGLTFCGKVSYPFDSHKLLSPAYGPSSLSLHIEKEDDSLTTYNFKAHYNNKEPNLRTFEILLDTPNSKANRKLRFLASVGSQPKQITAVINTPWKDLSFDGRITDTEKEHILSAKLLDDTTEYSFRLGAHVSGDENHKVFEPLLEYKLPEFRTTKSGLVGVKGGKGGKSHHGVAVGGIIKLDKNPDSGNRKYTFEGVTVTTASKTYKIDGTVAHDKNSLETDLKAAYEKESITLKSNLKKDFSEANKKLKVFVETAFSEQPDFNFVFDWEFNNDKNSLGNVLSVVHGPNSKSEDHKISINQYLAYQFASVKSFHFSTKNSLSYPLVSVSGAFNGESTPSSIDYELKGVYEKYHVSSSLSAKTGVTKPGDYNINFKAQVLDNSIDLHAKRDVVSDTKSKFTNSVEIKPGGLYQANAVINHSFRKDNFHNAIHAVIKFPSEPKEAKLEAGIKLNKKEFETEFEVSAGDKKFVEFKVEFEKDAPSGQFVANLPPHFNSNGQYKFDNNKGVGSFVFHFPKQDRKIEGKSELTLSGSKYAGFADIAWDATKQPDKKIRVETDSEFSKLKIESKNTFIYKGDQKTQLNFKRIVNSQSAEESLISEAELVLPSGRSFATSYNGKYTHQSDDYDGEVDIKFTDYIAPGQLSHKIGFKVNAKNVNPAKRSFDGQAQLSYANGAGKDANVRATLKKVLSGERWTISTSGSVSGSLPPYPVNFKFDSEVSEQFLNCRLAPDNSLPFGTYNLIFTAGELSFNGNGKVNHHQINNEIDLKLPKDYSVSTLKWTTNNQFTPNEKIKSSNDINWNGDKFFKVLAEGNKEENGVGGKLEWESHLKTARTVTANVHYIPNSEGDKKIDAALNFAYEGNVANVNLKADYVKKSEFIQVDVSGNLPQQGKFDVSVKNQVVNGGLGFQTDVTLNVNEKTITVTNHVVLDRENPLIDLIAEHPQGKSRVLFKIEKKGDRHYIGESKVKWVGNGGGNLAVGGEAKFDSVEDFFIKLNADSPKLNIEKYHFEVGNKPTKTSAKKITFVAKSADKTLFQGSTSYNYKDDGDTKVLDGSGTIKFDDKSFPLSFKYVRNVLNEANGENGNQVKINVKFGKNVYDVLGKLTTTTFILRRTYTKETGETSKAEISSKIKKYSLAEYDYEFNVVLNKILKDAEDLSLKIVTKRNGFILDHNFELHRSPDSKIKYHLYVHENQAGAVLTLPKRVVAAEAKYELPNSKDKGVISAEASLWLNKQQAPTEKTAISVNADVNKIGEGGSFSGEIRVTHPALGKDLVVSGHATVLQQWNKLIDAKVEFDVFAKKEQKINVEYKSVRNKEKDGYTVNQNLRVKGANVDVDYKSNAIASQTHFKYAVQFVYVDGGKVKRESKAVIDISPSKVDYLVKIPEGVLLSARTVLKETGNNYLIESQYEILGEKYSEQIEIKNQNNVKYNFIFDKGGKEKKLHTDFGFNLGQVAEFTSSFDNKELGYVHVALDDGNFLKSKYSYNTENFKYFIEAAKEDYIGAVKRVSKALQEAINRVSKDVVLHIEEAQKALPNFDAVVKAYTDQIEALRQEVVNEKSIQEAAEYIKGTLSVILEQVVIVLEEAAKTVQSLVAIFNEAAAKFSEAIKKLAPKVTEGYEKIAKIIVHLYEETLKYSVDVFNFILDKIKEHEEEIQVIVNATTEFLSEIGQLGAKVFVQFKGQIRDFIELFVEQIKALPIFSMIKEKLEELKTYEIPEQSWNDFHDFVSQIKEALPTPELSQFFGSVTSYVEKLVRHQDVNTDDLKNLYKEFVAAVKSVFVLVQQHVPQEKFVQPSLIPIPTFTIWKIPKGAIRFSPLSWLRSSDLPSVSEILYTYKPTLNPIDYIPPYKGVGYLVSSSEFFTFNQRHITFKGNCLYVLAQDFVDGNFSLAAKIEDGKVKSVILVDQKDSVELTSEGTVNVNGAPSEFPVIQGDLRAWRRYPSSNMYSKAGVVVHCSTDLEVCSFHVSGFYFGKTRGLLGRLNNEQYKDLTLPNGKIASSVTDFVNAYKLNSCGDIASPAPTAEQKSDICTNIFSSNSFKLCFPGVNPHHYRHACNLITAEAADKKAAACKIATAYYAACSNNGIRVGLPEECIQCSIAGKTVGADESVTINVPQNKADIVLVVEQVEENEEVFNQLITPLVSQLTKDFNAKGINDIHFSLIGFNAPNQKWPQHYTTNGKIDFNGKSTIYFTKKAAPEVSDNQYYEKFKAFKHKFDVEVGNTQIYVAFTEATHYPFRPDAVKSVIGVLGGPCETSGLPVSLQHARLALNYIFSKLHGVQFNLITQLHNLQHAEKDDKNSAPVSDVVGFTKDRVYFLNGAKDDDPSHYTHDYDVCVTFAHASDSNVFNSGNFKGAKTDSKKQFLHTLSGILVDSLTAKKFDFQCRCAEKDGLPKTDCQVEDESEKESLSQLVKKRVKSVKG